MKKDNKKALYESIMTSVAREVKKVLNEGENTYNNVRFPNIKYKQIFDDLIICDKKEEMEEILDNIIITFGKAYTRRKIEKNNNDNYNNATKYLQYALDKMNIIY